jgi:urea transport system substrate-binding protein
VARLYQESKERPNDPMEEAYILFHMWVQAVEQAATTDIAAIR